MGAVELRKVSRVFSGKIAALNAIDLNIARGEFVSILGPSGCGKSTLLRLIAELDRPTAGTISRESKKLAYVFQDSHLLPWRSAQRNVELPLELNCSLKRPVRQNRAREALAQVNLLDASDRYPAQLSGGMRMRASLARAMVTNPDLLLLDEPFAALDEITRQQLDDQLRTLWLSRKMTVIFVTHSISEAIYLADRAIVFSPRPGTIVLDHRVDLPAVRSGTMRSDAHFAAQSRILFDALQWGDSH